ncbi:MAG: ferredoxin [Hyphomicrobiaceae bacterium]|jgi:ferredoxin
MSSSPIIQFDGRDIPAGSDLPLIAYLAQANKAPEQWDCWDEDEPNCSGGSCGKCLVTVLTGARSLSPQSNRERNTIAKINRVLLDGQLDEALVRLCCQASCHGAVELRSVDVPWPAPTGFKVHNRVLLQGLTVMFQRALALSIKNELHGCARRVAHVLDLKLTNCRVPDFCTGDEALTEYHQIVHALQQLPATEKARVETLPEFARLAAVTTSPLFGLPAESDRLLPTREDAIVRALTTVATWSIEAVTTAAQSIAVKANDISLVGLAAQAGDPMLMILTRSLPAARPSSTVVADEQDASDLGGEFDWQVDRRFAASVGVFVDTANELLGADLPAATADNVSAYFWEHGRMAIGGQCVTLGKQGDSLCHWAIRGPHPASRTPGPDAEQFLANELWDSERYTREVHPRGWAGGESSGRRERQPCHCGSGRRLENCHGLNG